MIQESAQTDRCLPQSRTINGFATAITSPSIKPSNEISGVMAAGGRKTNQIEPRRWLWLRGRRRWLISKVISRPSITPREHTSDRMEMNGAATAILSPT
ncbi:hypothetical protein RRG08_054440 [Elysia crispata]|uniref:Uncharacterized protein n=1 Tax=Elysia crispata TaxID=231223 RepID=A0AAE1AX12_9GAST|nr:hypothetical protein RRG08_054440 [Elysia crispata]